jgi:hypothetical protein
VFLLGLLCVGRAWAHVGSPDVYVRGDAGPYAIYVSVHPPAALPGVAEVDVQVMPGDAEITTADVVSGDGHATSLHRFVQEQRFVGSTWIPADASVWKLQLRVNGGHGVGEMLIPVTLPAVRRQRGRWVGPVVFACVGMALLIAGIAMWRERGLQSAVALLVCSVVSLGASAAGVMQKEAQYTVTPVMQVEMRPGGMLRLKLTRTAEGHALDDMVPDHAHLMHLFLLREPQMDVVLHLHPALVSASRDEAEFTEMMPSMAAGQFALYADIAHSDGVLETAGASVGLPMQTGHALSGDDSVGVVSHSVGVGCGSTAVLVDGYRMTLQCPGPLRAKSGYLLRVTLEDATGHAPVDMENYIGMGGHAVVVAEDHSAFAHIHPMGTVMAFSSGNTAMDGMQMPVSNVVEFPYGFPRAGVYRVFVQMKHGAVVETGAFAVTVQ